MDSIMLKMEDPRNPLTSEEKQLVIDKTVLGKGAYGKVYKGLLEKNKCSRQVAIKQMVYCPSATNGIPLAALREIGATSHCSGSNHVVKLLDFCELPTNNPHEKRLVLVYELMTGDLTKFLKDRGNPDDMKSRLPMNIIQKWSKQLLQGVDYMHTHRIIHRDLKPDNILIDKDTMTLKIADLGLAHAQAFEGTRTPEVVTLWYRAPEVILRKPYCSAIDMWSVGLIIIEMLKLRPIIVGSAENEVLRNILKLIGKPPNHVDLLDKKHLRWESFVRRAELPLVSHLHERLAGEDVRLVDLVERLLVFDQVARLTAYEAMQHPFFDEEFSAPGDDSISFNFDPASLTSDDYSMSTDTDTSSSDNEEEELEEDEEEEKPVAAQDNPQEVVRVEEDLSIGVSSPDPLGLSRHTIELRRRRTMAGCSYGDNKSNPLPSISQMSLGTVHANPYSDFELSQMVNRFRKENPLTERAFCQPPVQRRRSEVPVRQEPTPNPPPHWPQAHEPTTSSSIDWLMPESNSESRLKDVFDKRRPQGAEVDDRMSLPAPQGSQEALGARTEQTQGACSNPWSTAEEPETRGACGGGKSPRTFAQARWVHRNRNSPMGARGDRWVFPKWRWWSFCMPRPEVKKDDDEEFL